MTTTLLQGDCRDVLPTLPERSVQTVVTSPPYFGLRDYGADGQIGLEPTPAEFVAALVDVFRAVRRVLRDDGTVWLNLGDSYSSDGGARTYGSSVPGRRSIPGPRPSAPSLLSKQLIGIPWRVAFALQDDGWWLRSEIIWHKPNCMPESVTDRPTRAHEHVFLLAKRAEYYYDADAVREDSAPSSLERAHLNDTAKPPPRSYEMVANGTHKGVLSRAKAYGQGRNRRTVWTIPTAPYRGAHFATFPEALVEPCVRAGSRPGDTVLDPFAGSGTTLRVAERLGRDAIGIELNPAYIDLQERRLDGVQVEIPL